MGLSLAQLRTELRDHLGVDSTELADADADLLLNRSWWKVADNYKFKQKEKSTTFNTVIGTEEYNAPADLESLTGIYIKDPNSLDYDPLEQRSDAVFESDATLNTSVRAKPEYYIHRVDKIALQPIPDAVYVIKETYMSTLADVSTALSVPQAWHEAVLYGAIWRGFAKFGDWNRSVQAKVVQMELLNSQEPVKERETKADARFAGVQILRRPYR